MTNEETKVVSIRATIKLLNAIAKNYPEASVNQSKVLIRLLKCGHYYLQYHCKELVSDITKNGSIKDQVDAAYWRGLIHMYVGMIALIIATFLFFVVYQWLN